jgi:anti-sigma factor RsiW
VVDLKLAGWEDRNVLIVVIGSEASAPAVDAAVARCQ